MLTAASIHASPFLLGLLLAVSLTVPNHAQVTINELAAHPTEKIVKWAASGAPSVGSGTPWQELAFNSSGWTLGSAPFGHGVTGLGTDLTMAMSGKAYSLYLRKEFTASAAQAASTALLRLQIDYNDGFVAYLNGIEITRKNLGAAKHFVYAAQRAYNPSTISGVSDLSTVAANQILVTGTNVLAIQVHNYDLATSLKLDAALSLTGGATFISSGAASGQWRYFVGVHEPSGIVVDTKLVTQPFTAPVGREKEYEDPQKARPWIELHNAGAADLDLTGWSLTDKLSQPAKWLFPSGTTIPTGGHLIVMCDERQEANGAATADHLHASFELDKDGGTIAVFNGTTQVDSLVYPADQTPHTTFGRSASNGENLVFFETGTPGAANSGVEQMARAQAPAMKQADGQTDLPGGFYSTSQSVTLVSTTPGATLRYTLDGSDPMSTSTAYTTPLTAAFVSDKSGVVIRARAFATGMLPSAITTSTYLIDQNAALKTLPATIMTGSDSRVFYKPHGITSIEGGNYDASAQWIPGNTETYNVPLLEGDVSEREISLEYLRPDAMPGFTLQAGVRLSASNYSRPRLRLQQMDSSPWPFGQWEEKPSFSLYFRGAYGPGKLNHGLFPGYDVTRFNGLRLRAGKNDNFNPHIVDELCRRAHMAMGHEGIIGTWTNLYVNGRFKGYYNLVEVIKEASMQEHFGGSARWDVVEPYVTDVIAEDGDLTQFNQLFDVTLAADLTVPANWAVVKQQMDLDNVCDYFLMKFYAAMWDWPNTNWCMVRERSTGPNAVWRFIDWDSEAGFNAIGYTGQNVNFDMIGSLFAINSTRLQIFFNRLRTSGEFRLRFADRVQKHMFNGGVLDDRGSSFWLKTQKDALKAQVQPIITYVTGQAFNDSWFATWTAASTGRRSYLLGPNGTQLATYGLWPATAAPVLSLQGGSVSQGSTLTLSGTGGTIYYTTDGSDPRLEGGGISPTALVYSAALTLNASTMIRTRMRSAGGEWSPLSEASFIVNTVAPTAADLVIAEFMYNPPSATVAETQAPNAITNGDDFEFIRLQNISASNVLMGQVTLANGINYAFSGSGITSIAPGQSVLVVKSLVAFQKRYGTAYNSMIATGNFSGSLSNSGETVELRNNGTLLQTVTYSDSAPWPKSADGYGPSLMLRDPFSAPDHSLVASWIPSAGAGGQPGGVPFATTWAQWRDLSFHRTNDASAIKDADDDPDGDGIPNALEYALGTAPNIRDDPAAVLPQALMVDVSGQHHLALSYHFNTAAAEATLAIETSTTLDSESWRSGPGYTEAHTAPVPFPGGLQSVTTRATAPLTDDSRRFMRLKVSVP